MAPTRKPWLMFGLVVALIESTIGIVPPGLCQVPPPSDPGVVAAASPPRWFATGSLNTPRYRHTATLLRDGRVLVVGGVDGRVDVVDGAQIVHVLDSAELYDPVSGTWINTGHLARPRSDHTATLLPDGRVLVVGGFATIPEVPEDPEIYDPVTGTWSPTGGMSTARINHAATLLTNGKVLVTGGEYSTTRDTDRRNADLFDPATDTWSATGILSAVRRWHFQLQLPDGHVLVAGGWDGTGQGYTPIAELYDVATGSWSRTGNIKLPVESVPPAMLPNGNVLVTGGTGVESGYWEGISTTQLYDAAAGTWTLRADMSAARSGHTATTLANGKVLVIGGFYARGISSAELYDSVGNQWTSIGDSNLARGDHTATLLPDGSVLVVGGYAYDGDGVTGSAGLFVPPGNVSENSFRVTHLFSNRSGSAQIIQLSELSGLDGQNNLSGRTLIVVSNTGVTKKYTFPYDLPHSNTKYRAVTLGTETTSDGWLGDYLLPAGFLPTDGGTIYFGDSDSWTFGPLPIDGHTITARTGAANFIRDFSESNWQPVFVVDTVVEYYHQVLDHYFMTVSQPEIDALDSGRVGGWKRTGSTIRAWITRDRVFSLYEGDYIPPPGIADVCRYYIPPAQGDSHFFSASSTECSVAKTAFPTFILETASAFFAALPDPVTGVCANGQDPVYRVWNKRVDSNHRYLTTIAARDEMVRRGYVAEGYGPERVAMCVGGYGG